MSVSVRSVTWSFDAWNMSLWTVLDSIRLIWMIEHCSIETRSGCGIKDVTVRKELFEPTSRR